MHRLEPLEIVRRATVAAEAHVLTPPLRPVRGPRGEYQVRAPGVSLEFHEYRAYHPGDDLRRVDWGVYARSEQLVVRQSEDELAPTLEVLLDPSASMGLYPGKADAAIFLSAFLTTVARRGHYLPALLMRGRRHSQDSVDAVLRSLTFDDAPDPLVPSREWPGGARKPARMLLTDLLFPLEPESWLGTLRQSAHWLVVIAVLSQSEVYPGVSGGVRFVDAEDSRFQKRLRITPSVISRYQERLSGHLGQVAEACRRQGITLIRLEVPDAFENVEALEERCVRQLLSEHIVRR